MTNDKSVKVVDLLESKLTYKLRGVFLSIAAKYGNKFKENFYHNLCKEYFIKRKIKFNSKKKINLCSIDTGKVLDFYIPDFIIEDKILVEIKVQHQVLDSHTDQLMKYLSVSRYEIGLLVNFGSLRVQILRRINTNDRKSFLHNSNNHREARNDTE